MENKTPEHIGPTRGYLRYLRARFRDPNTRRFLPLGVVSIIGGFLRSPLWGLELVGILLAAIAFGSIVQLFQLRRQRPSVPQGESIWPSSDAPPPEPGENNRWGA